MRQLSGSGADAAQAEYRGDAAVFADGERGEESGGGGVGSQVRRWIFFWFCDFVVGFSLLKIVGLFQANQIIFIF